MIILPKFNEKIHWLKGLFFSLLLSTPILSQSNNNLKLSLEDAVKNVLENNLTVKNAKLEIAKTDTATIKIPQNMLGNL